MTLHWKMIRLGWSQLCLLYRLSIGPCSWEHGQCGALWGKGRGMWYRYQVKKRSDTPKTDWLLLLTSLAFTWTFFTTFLKGQTTCITMGSHFLFSLYFLLLMHFFVSWLCLMGHQGIFKKKINNNKLTCILTLFEMYIHRFLIEQSWFENDSVPLPIWGHCVELSTRFPALLIERF